jgi:hypothetical protein
MATKKVLLLTSAGGVGSNSLVETLKSQLKADYYIIGTHYDPLELVKSDIDKVFVVPKASDKKAYIKAHIDIIEKFSVDAVIVNSDVEVEVFSRYKDEISCRIIIPSEEIVSFVQDKFKLNRLLDESGYNAILNISINDKNSIQDAVSELRLREGDKFWIRTRRGSGSLGASWFYTAEQAEKWVSLWGELRGIPSNEYIVSPFLPGRDFCVVTVWDKGKVVLGKIIERIKYLAGNVTLSGMDSSPCMSITVDDVEPIDESINVINAVYKKFKEKPHGYYQTDIKCSSEGVPYVTEINIGRFPMINSHFDRVGKYSPLEVYMNLLFEKNFRHPDTIYDLDPDKYILLSVDSPVLFVDKGKVDSIAMYK